MISNRQASVSSAIFSGAASYQTVSVALPATLDAVVAMPGTYISGIYRLYATADTTTKAAMGTLYIDTSNNLVDVETTSFGTDFEFFNDAGTFVLKNLTSTAHTVDIKAVKEK